MPEQRPDRQPRKKGRPTAPPGMKFGRGIFGWAVFIGLVAMLFVLLKTSQGGTSDVRWTDFEEQLVATTVREMKLDADAIDGEFNTAPAATGGNVKFHTVMPQGAMDFSALLWLTEHRGTAKITATNNQSLIL